MKCIGLLGGMSWVSSEQYYILLNEHAKEQFGGVYSSNCILRSLNFQEIADLQKENNWTKCAQILAQEAKMLEKAGAQLIILCTNTMHIVAEQIIEAITIPFLHIIDIVGLAIKERQLKTVALLGTSYTMEHGFYKEYLENRYGLEVVIPQANSRKRINEIIFSELCKNIISSSAKDFMLSEISNLKELGAEGIILGCTELPLLFTPSEKIAGVELFDTTELHVKASIEFALKA